MDLIRLILLAIEADNRFDGRLQLKIPLHFAGYTSEEVAYHCRLLIDGGFVAGEIRHGHRLSCRGLTHAGHDMVDAIRDPEVWRKTKEAATAVGSWTVEVIQGIATQYLKSKIKSVVGVDL
jgi:hypothetical protein